MDLSEGDREFCTDEELGYGRSRFLFAAGTGLRLDEAYRLAHLPLVAPTHPDVIRARELPIGWVDANGWFPSSCRCPEAL
jgi:hypothetical protein